MVRPEFGRSRPGLVRLSKRYDWQPGLNHTFLEGKAECLDRPAAFRGGLVRPQAPRRAAESTEVPPSCQLSICTTWLVLRSPSALSAVLIGSIDGSSAVARLLCSRASFHLLEGLGPGQPKGSYPNSRSPIPVTRGLAFF